MPPTLADDSGELGRELYLLLEELDSTRRPGEVDARARRLVASIERRLSTLLDASWGPEGWAAVEPQLARISGILHEHVPAPTANVRVRRAWRSLRKQLQPAYESLAEALKVWDVQLPQLRATNYARNLFHAFNALLALLVFELVLDTWTQYLAATAFFAGLHWGVEAARRTWPRFNDLVMRLFRRAAHPREWNTVSSATWYATALLALTLIGSEPLGAIAIPVLGFADPAAALIGRKLGRVPLVGGRTLEGSLSFVLIGGGVAFAALMLWHGELGWAAALAMALSGATGGAIAELISGPVDDNITVPLGAAAGGALAALLLGAPLY